LKYLISREGLKTSNRKENRIEINNRLC